MRRSFLVMTVLSVLFGVNAAFAETHIADGKIVEIVPSKREIYISTDEGKKNEYYFTDTTRIIENNEDKKFSDLSLGLRVRVTSEKIGKRLNPKQVDILQ